MIHFKEQPKLLKQQIHDLYHALNWTQYTKDMPLLVKAISQSTYVVGCFDDNQLIGLVRVISDDASIGYIQDILIIKKYQNQGIGKQLMDRVIKRFTHVRQLVLMSDDESKTNSFYQSCGFVRGSDIHLNLFVKIKNIE